MDNRGRFEMSKRALDIRRRHCAAAAALMILCSAFTASAQTVYTWTGLGGNDSFTNTGNWVGSVNGAAFGVQTFTGSTRLTPFLDANLNTHRFIFTNAESFVISGARITFFDNSGTDPVIRNNSTNLQTINNYIRGDDTFANDPLLVQANNGDIHLMGTVSNIGSTLVITGGNDNRYVGFGGQVLGTNVNVDSGQMRLFEGGSIDGINANATMGVGAGATTNTAAAFYIADMDGGTIVNKAINVNSGNGSGGNRVVGGLNTSGTNTFNGNISRSATGNKAVTLSAAAGGTVDFNGQITGDHLVVVRGPGNVRFGGNNAYAANTSIESGQLHVKQGGTVGAAGQTIFLGFGATPAVAAGLMIADDDGGTTVAQNIQVNPGVNANRTIGGLNTSGVNTFAGNITMSAASGGVTLYAAVGGTTAFSGLISGTNDVTTTGDGIVRYDNKNPYTGKTVVEAGTLRLGDNGAISNSPVIEVREGATFDVGNSGFSLSSGQTITGKGNVDGALVLRANSTLAPGSSPGQMTFSDELLLELDSILEIEIGGYGAGTDYDQVVMANSALFNNQGAILNVVFLNGFENSVAYNSVFTVVNGNNSGAFKDIGEGDVINSGGVDLRVSYNSGSDITLTVVPEPSTLALTGLALVALLRFRRR